MEEHVFKNTLACGEREREDEYEEEKVTGEDKEEICTEEMGGGFSQNTFYSHI